MEFGCFLSGLLLFACQLHTIIGGHQSDNIRNFAFLGKAVGRQCLCDLLGIGVNRFRRCLNIQPDLRIGMNKSGSQKLTYSVDAFLTIQYEGVAETLPDRFVRRGRAASGEDSDLDIEVGSEAPLEDLKDWLDRPGQGGSLWQCVEPSSRKMCKYLPPGTVADLYEHYQATRQLFGAAAVSYLGLNAKSTRGLVDVSENV